MAAWMPFAAVLTALLASGCLAIGEPTALECPNARVTEVHSGSFGETYTSIVVLEGRAEELRVGAELAEGDGAFVQVRDPDGNLVLEAALDATTNDAAETVPDPAPGKWTAVVERPAGAAIEVRWSC